MSPSPALFKSVPEKDYFEFLPKGEPEYQAIVHFFDFKKEDVAKAADVSPHSVRYDEKMPDELQERIREWAISVNLVAEFFNGDLDRTINWFKMPNPSLGYISPRDMIRIGRFKKLLKFITNAIDENRH